MKKIFTTLLCSMTIAGVYAQWTPATLQGEKKRPEVQVKQYYSLDLQSLKAQLSKATEAGKGAVPVVISLPTLDGKVEKFAVYSAPVVVKSLADKYQLGSYSGVGIDDPTKFVRFSTSPDRFESMLFSNGSYQFIEPQNKENTVYGVFPKSKKTDGAFECLSSESLLSKSQIDKLAENKNFSSDVTNFQKADDKKFRTYCLAISVTGEYTQYFGGTVAGALAGINTTMTRVNGVFEKDFAIRLLLQDFPELIYTNASTDPYSNASTGASGAWNLELQQNLTAVIGNDAYDIGHLFGRSGGGGSAGDVGNVCRNPSSNSDSEAKGSAFTSPGSGGPEGDNFDIDFVAHEMGHQFGADHTFSHGLHSAPNNTAHMEPGSGSTIMGYAGITSADVQAHSDPYFHVRSIEQVQTYVNSQNCDINTPITNTPPVVAALPDLTIPKGTAFKLTASATDSENDPITYTWEEYDRATSAVTDVTGNNTTGPKFRSITGTSEPYRYFPKLESVLAGNLSSAENWEAVSNVARTMNFRVTVRDNNADVAQQQTSIGAQKITVGSAGPFKVSSTEIFNNAEGPFNWDVAGTDAAPYNVANVKIDYTTDNGESWTVVKESTPNDGSEDLQFGSLTVGTTAIVRVSAINNVFYAVGATNVITLQACSGEAPASANVTDITSSSATFFWNAVEDATYVLKYKKASATEWTEVEVDTNTYTATGLEESEQYEYQVAAVCSGTTGEFTESKFFVTGLLEYCTLSSTNSNDEFISNVKVTPQGGIEVSNNSGASNYTDYTSNENALITLAKGSTNNVISIAKSWTGSQFNEAVTVWIDFDRDGTFASDEIIMQSAASKTTPVTETFAVPADAYSGDKPVRMRVALRYNQSQTEPCGTYTYGEVEDYAVVLTGSLAVSDAQSGKALSVYPNPATDVLNVAEVSANATYAIHSIAGQVVAKGKLNDGKVNVSGLGKGVYIISIDDNGNASKVKFIKK